MTGMAALWNTSAVDAVTASSVSAFHSGIQHSVRRTTAGRACKSSVARVCFIYPGSIVRNENVTNGYKTKKFARSCNQALGLFCFSYVAEQYLASSLQTKTGTGSFCVATIL